MISNPTLYRRGQRFLIAAIVLSLLLHTGGAVVWSIATGRWPWLQPPPHQEKMVVLSTATTIGRMSVPVPVRAYHNPHPARMGEQLARHASSTEEQARVAMAATPVPRRELTYVAPHAPPKPAKKPRRAHVARLSALAMQMAQDQASFTREIARLQTRDNPLSVATIPPRPPSSFRRDYMNVSGVVSRRETFQGIVTPLRTWFEGNMRCHYASYDVEYSSGADDKGDIPWPLCYRPSLDPMVLPNGEPVPNGSPVPAEDLFPMEGYVLPSGTYLTKFLRLLYDRQI